MISSLIFFQVSGTEYQVIIAVDAFPVQHGYPNIQSNSITTSDTVSTLPTLCTANSTAVRINYQDTKNA